MYTYYPPIYWNTACISSEAGSNLIEDFNSLIKRGHMKPPLKHRAQTEVLRDEYYELIGLDSPDGDAAKMTAEEIEQGLQEYIKEQWENEGL